jgi:phosphoserine phosphatase RsbU/P
MKLIAILQLFFYTISTGVNVNRKTIAFIVDYLDSEYQNALFQGIITAAVDNNFNLITLCGTQFFNPREMCPQKNDIFSLVKSGCIHGVIILTGSLGHYCSRQDVIDFVRFYLPVPVVSISVAIPGIPSILVDNSTGFKELLTHLITEHHYQRFAFIKGPAQNQEANSYTLP